MVGLLTIELHLPDSRSLKDKRRIVRALKDRLRGRFNVAVAETEFQDLHQRGAIEIVTAAADAVALDARLRSVEEEAERILAGALLRSAIRLL